MDPFLNAFRGHVAADPSAAACLWAQRECTRAELAAQIESAASVLARRGVGAGSVVALSSPPGPAFVAAWLALRSVDACALLVDVSSTPRERARILGHLGAGHIWIVEDGWDLAPMPGELAPLAPAEPAHLPGIATLKLTSGSTGLPCAVAVRAAELLADGRNLAATMGLTGADRLLCTIPFSHSYGFSLLPTSLCLHGSPLVFAGTEDPLEVAARSGATVLPSVPAWYQARLGTRRGDPWPASLRLFVSAGAPLPVRTAREWRASCGRPIHVFYGSSECGGISFDREGGAAERGTVGSPVEGVRVELGPGGVVRVRSAAVASGYFRADAARSARLAGGCFETEDLGAFEDGELALRGRRSGWINVKGKKVDPREIEEELEQLPGVHEVAVVAAPLPDDRGESVRAVVACDAGALSYQDVVAWCRARLARHKVPRSVVLVRSLPRNERGKLDLARLEGM